MSRPQHFRPGPMLRIPIIACLALISSAVPAEDGFYDLLYVAKISAGDSTAAMSINLRQPRDLVRKISFSIDPQRHSRFTGEGSIERTGDTIHWVPPENGGTIRWLADFSSRRSSGGYDGMITSDWAVLRGDDLVPPARTRTLKGARSRARLRFELPDNWSAIASYRKLDNGDFQVENPERRFDRPTGWMTLGELGTRWATIANTQVAVSGPKGQGLRRQDILAFLRWTLPALREIVPSAPDRLLIVGAGDPMWRGGLSGPGSLFIHADRPLISENGTSTLLHELVHVATSLRSKRNADWIVEGLAEYYSLQVLLRSGTISDRSYRKSLARLEKWSRGVTDPRSGNSRGKTTARAVMILKEVDENIRAATKNARSLDSLVRVLVSEGEVSNARFVELAEELAGKQIRVLDPF